MTRLVLALGPAKPQALTESFTTTRMVISAVNVSPRCSAADTYRVMVRLCQCQGEGWRAAVRDNRHRGGEERTRFQSRFHLWFGG
jgi:hypothetical protein